MGMWRETGQAFKLISKDGFGPLESGEPQNDDKPHNTLSWHCRWSFQQSDRECKQRVWGQRVTASVTSMFHRGDGLEWSREPRLPVAR